MSKDQKKTIIIPVETVEKIDFILNWITSTITFWKLDKKWPMNIIQDTVYSLIELLQPYWKDPLK